MKGVDIHFEILIKILHNLSSCSVTEELTAAVVNLPPVPYSMHVVDCDRESELPSYLRCSVPILPALPNDGVLFSG